MGIIGIFLILGNAGFIHLYIYIYIYIERERESYIINRMTQPRLISIARCRVRGNRD